MDNHQINILIDGNAIKTLDDILPETPGLKLLFVAKVPTPDSVDAGHYFQGNQGKMFWKKLKDYGILNVPLRDKEDDHLLRHNFGMIDIVKIPRSFGLEPCIKEYIDGIPRLFDLLEIHKPQVIVFVYKKVLDKILYWRFKQSAKSRYGFNENLDYLFGCRVFVFPMPGTPCKGEDADKHMKLLANYIQQI